MLAGASQYCTDLAKAPDERGVLHPAQLKCLGGHEHSDLRLLDGVSGTQTEAESDAALA